MEQENKKSFNEIYEEICFAGRNELNHIKKEKNIGLALVIIFFALMAIDLITIKNVEITCLLMIVMILVCVKYIREKNKYKERYKELVIKKMVNMYSPKLDFVIGQGVSDEEYRQSRFTKTSYNAFSSEDLIKGTVFKDDIPIKMSQVKIEHVTEERDENGNSTENRTVLFFGLYGMVKLQKNNIGAVHVLINYAMERNKADRIEMDSAEFEKYYDFMATDKVRAMQVFTSEVIELLNRFKDVTKQVMEIKIEPNGIMYFRTSCGDVFEPPEFKDALDMETIHKYYNIIDLPLEIIKMICENMKSLE